MISRNFRDLLGQFIASDKAYSFMSTIKGTPWYWKKSFQELLGMTEQLIVSLSQLSEEDARNLSYNERCNSLAKNSV